MHAHMHATLAGALVVQRRPHCAAYLAGADPHEVARLRDVEPATCVKAPSTVHNNPLRLGRAPASDHSFYVTSDV